MEVPINEENSFDRYEDDEYTQKTISKDLEFQFFCFSFDPEKTL